MITLRCLLCSSGRTVSTLGPAALAFMMLARTCERRASSSLRCAARDSFVLRLAECPLPTEAPRGGIGVGVRGVRCGGGFFDADDDDGFFTSEELLGVLASDDLLGVLVAGLGSEADRASGTFTLLASGALEMAGTALDVSFLRPHPIDDCKRTVMYRRGPEKNENSDDRTDLEIEDQDVRQLRRVGTTFLGIPRSHQTQFSFFKIRIILFSALGILSTFNRPAGR